VFFFDFTKNGLFYVVAELMGAATIVPAAMFVAAVFAALMHQNPTVAVMAHKRTTYTDKIHTSPEVMLAVRESPIRHNYSIALLRFWRKVFTQLDVVRIQHLVV